MTVRERMDQILQAGQNLIDCGEFRIDHRPHGFIQNPGTGEVIAVYESRDDIDDQGRPVVVDITYPNLEGFMRDFIVED